MTRSSVKTHKRGLWEFQRTDKYPLGWTQRHWDKAGNRVRQMHLANLRRPHSQSCASAGLAPGSEDLLKFSSLSISPASPGPCPSSREEQDMNWAWVKAEINEWGQGSTVSLGWASRRTMLCQLLSGCIQLFGTHELQHVRLPCLSLSPRVCSDSFHWVDDAIQPSHPLLPLSPPVLSLSQHQGLFQWVDSSHRVAKVIRASALASVFPMNIQGWFPLGLTDLISLLSKGFSRVLQHHSSKASVLRCSAFCPSAMLCCA